MEETKEEGVKPKFDPTKAYRWNNNDNFYLSGAEFGVILNTLRAMAGSEVAQVFRVLDKSLPVLDAVLAKGWELGIVKMVDDQPPKPEMKIVEEEKV